MQKSKSRAKWEKRTATHLSYLKLCTYTRILQLLFDEQKESSAAWECGPSAVVCNHLFTTGLLGLTFWFKFLLVEIELKNKDH